MKIVNYILSILFIAFFFLACEPEGEPDFVYPKQYLPAYPGSYWDYTNGERVLTGPGYELHSYQSSISSTEKTDSKYVPVYNGTYLYEYSIIQSSTVYPLKKLLDETVGSDWLVNEINDVSIMRQVTGTIDSMIIEFPPYTNPIDCVFMDIIVVVEYLDTLGVNRWNTKEYYAKDVGLIQVEVDDPFDEEGAVLQKQIQGYDINK